MIIIDTNIIAAIYIKTPHMDEAQSLLVHDPYWFAPRLWRSELRNVLVQYMRHGKMAFADALEVMQASEEFIQVMDVEISSTRILRLAHSSGCSAYDCEYIALAQELGTALITLDKKLLATFPTIAYTPKAFLAASG